MSNGIDSPLPEPDRDEDDESRTLRPTTWADYVGQTTIKDQLRTKCRAAHLLKRPLPHLLIHGPMGTGKTTLAHLASIETGDYLEVISRKVDQRGLMQALWNIPGGQGILFIDEAHRLSASVQEDLLTLTEEGFIQSRWGTEEFPWLTVILATTEKRLIVEPLQSRCTVLDLEDYSHDEMTEIVRGMARRAHVELDAEACAALATAAVGMPRAARHLVLAAKELVAVGETPTVDEVLRLCRLDADGLGSDHRKYLSELLTLGGQAGLEVLTVRLQLHKTQVQRIERVLIDRGYVKYDTRGRVLTATGRARLQGRSLRPLREMAS